MKSFLAVLAISTWIFVLEGSCQEKLPKPFDKNPNSPKDGASSANASLDKKRLSESLVNWNRVREVCGGNYSYKVIKSSFTGFRTETTVVVKANKVVERRFETGMPGIPGMAFQLKIEWVENHAEIGSHKGVAEPKTLDELYELAKKIVETEVPAEHIRSLGLDKQGLLNHCFIRDTRIQDDAPVSGVPFLQLSLGKK